MIFYMEPTMELDLWTQTYVIKKKISDTSDQLHLILNLKNLIQNTHFLLESMLLRLD